MQIKIKIPDDLHRRLKSTIEEFRFPLDDFVAEAIEQKLRHHPSRKGKPWMKSFGGLKHMHEENVRIQQIIDEEFERID